VIVGFDFGTTNSLVSVVVEDRVIDVLDEEGRPHPSVVRYEGEAVIVGREARHALEEVGLGVYGNTVRSPKILLGQQCWRGRPKPDRHRCQRDPARSQRVEAKQPEGGPRRSGSRRGDDSGADERTAPGRSS